MFLLKIWPRFWTEKRLHVQPQDGSILRPHPPFSRWKFKMDPSDCYYLYTEDFKTVNQTNLCMCIHLFLFAFKLNKSVPKHTAQTPRQYKHLCVQKSDFCSLQRWMLTGSSRENRKQKEESEESYEAKQIQHDWQDVTEQQQRWDLAWIQTFRTHMFLMNISLEAFLCSSKVVSASSILLRNCLKYQKRSTFSFLTGGDFLKYVSPQADCVTDFCNYYKSFNHALSYKLPWSLNSLYDRRWGLGSLLQVDVKCLSVIDCHISMWVFLSKCVSVKQLQNTCSRSDLAQEVCCISSISTTEKERERDGNDVAATAACGHQTHNNPLYSIH